MRLELYSQYETAQMMTESRKIEKMTESLKIEKMTKSTKIEKSHSRNGAKCEPYTEKKERAESPPPDSEYRNETLYFIVFSYRDCPGNCLILGLLKNSFLSIRLTLGH